MDIRKKVFSLMKERNMTQQELAEKLGITQATLSRNLNGIHEPRANVVEKIAEVFGVPVDFLLGSSQNNKKIEPTPNEQLQGVKLALFDQVNTLSDDEVADVLKYAKFIKSTKE